MSLNIEEAIRRLKSLVDNLRCGFCDQLEGVRLRYSCGHSACQECVSTSDSCFLCLTPPGVVHVDPIVDNSLTNRVQNAQILLNTFQDLFHVDVYKWCRLSEELKVEKELFPECIQAPSKYFNKRRSSTHLEKSQESSYPGEFVHPLESSKMSFNFVQQWLDNNDTDFKQKALKRKPLSDLNVNISSNSPIKKRADLILDRVKDFPENLDQTCKTKDRKRKHFKRTTALKSYNPTNSLTNRSKSSSKLTHRITKKCDTLNSFKFTKNEKEESGIVIDDDDDLIIIPDSQSEVIDKDKLAWLAVQEAEKHEHVSASILRLEHSSLFVDRTDNTNKNKFYKTPFYKKGKLHECCHYCKSEAKEVKQEISFKPVSITIENDSFTTTIKVMNDKNLQANGKTSRSVQTDDVDLNCIQIIGEQNEGIMKKSQDIFNNGTSTVKLVKEDSPESPKESNVEEVKCLMVVDSDSDAVEGSSLQVTADVHKSSEKKDYGVLCELSSPRARATKRPRGHTPTSTDSSDKENRDPNRPNKSKKKKKLKF